MANFDPQIIDSVLAACQAGQAEISAALSRALDAAIELTASQAGTFAAATSALGSNSGLLVQLSVGQQAAAVVLSEASGLLPAWFASNDPTRQSKLTTLAQELGTLVLPENFAPQGFRAERVSNLATALQAGQPAADAGVVELKLKAGAKLAEGWLIWPFNLNQPDAMYSANIDDLAVLENQLEGAEKITDRAKASAVNSAIAANSPTLPLYTQSLMRIRVPIIVSLAAKQQPLGHILDLGPGSIIHFNKSCEEMLDLHVGGRPIALGEAVKVGDKFGIRLTSMILPEERFKVVGRGGIHS